MLQAGKPPPSPASWQTRSWSRGSTMSFDVSVIVPTLNEQDNIARVYGEVRQATEKLKCEIVFVDDDSRDSTRERVRDLQREDSSVRLVHRIGRRGLSSAIQEGILASSGRICGVVDADLQHDISIVPKLVDLIERGQCDIAVGTRYAETGSAAGLANRERERLSQFGTKLAKLFLAQNVSDPMSGMFFMRRKDFDRVARKTYQQGFKILFDILYMQPQARVSEVPYVFRERTAGESKLDLRVQWEFLTHLLYLMTWRIVPAGLISFGMVGCIGLFVHFAVLAVWLLLRASFLPAHIVATLIASAFNFALNNSLTFRNRQLRGVALLNGLIKYLLISSVGIFLNIGIAYAAYETYSTGPYLASMVGALVDLIWRYAVSSQFIWKTEGT